MSNLRRLFPRPVAPPAPPVREPLPSDAGGAPKSEHAMRQAVEKLEQGQFFPGLHNVTHAWLHLMWALPEGHPEKMDDDSALALFRDICGYEADPTEPAA